MEVGWKDSLAPSFVRWPDPARGPWEVMLTWRAREDRADCVGLALTPVNPDDAEPVTATLMRALPVAGIIAAARQWRFAASGGSVVEAYDEPQNLNVDPEFIEYLRAASEPWSERRPGRRPQLDRDHYRVVAEIYSTAHLAGHSPLRAVEKRWTVSRPTASRWVAAARAEGLLPPTQKGRASGNAALVTGPQPDQEPGR